MQVTVHDAADAIDADEWNRLAGDDYPFLRHAFFSIAESTGCAAEATGWTPRHLTLHDGGRLRAIMPLYEKTHSWGEFVFDWAWAEAYQRYGLAYYPKLVSAVPFTPATSTRLMVDDPSDQELKNMLLEGATTACQELGCSSLHLLFPRADEVITLDAAGFMNRSDCQFHWHNANYADFDQFLASFSRVKRKKVRQDRRRVRDAGIGFRHLHGGELDDALWKQVYALISVTFLRRGGPPYFNQSFFKQLSVAAPNDLLVVLAEQHSQVIAAAIFFCGRDTLYGRYWGADGYYDALHFETCYYQGIEYCIQNDISHFEPGTQGEHKIARGFVPERCHSSHWLANEEFRDAIQRYLEHESEHTDRYIDMVDAHSPYRDDPSP
ncbi:MAG: GNAT family N-acetyltransferase [Pseudomonadota bacterium]